MKTTETWLFTDIRKSQKEVTDLEIKLPDTLGTWIVKGFSLHPEKGLGIFQSNLIQIRTIKPYSLFIHLPYSVKLGETVRIPVLIVNLFFTCFFLKWSWHWIMKHMGLKIPWNIVRDNFLKSTNTEPKACFFLNSAPSTQETLFHSILEQPLQLNTLLFIGR